MKKFIVKEEFENKSLAKIVGGQREEKISITISMTATDKTDKKTDSDSDADSSLYLERRQI